MNYNFDEVVCRLGSNSYKWDSPDSEHVAYPLWVADMDWRAAQPIIDALHKRVEHGVFGYVTTPDSLREAVINWYSRKHQWTIRKEQISTTTGVVPAITAILKTLRSQGRKRVLLNAPAYNCFYACIDHAGCELTESHLINNDGHYEYDWDDMEKKMSDADIFILCNPHNPTGRVWTREELSHIYQLCLKHHIFVIADEIHCEFAWHNDYTPFANIAAEEVSYVTMTSATKAFNIAGLQLASLISCNGEVKRIVDEALEASHLEDLNPFGVVATEAAFNLCEDWLEQMNRYVEGNYIALKEWFEQNAPAYKVTRMDGTYLSWIDCSCSKYSTEELCRRLVKEASVKFNPGAMYGDERYIRINMACPRSVMLEALNRSLPIL